MAAEMSSDLQRGAACETRGIFELQLLNQADMFEFIGFSTLDWMVFRASPVKLQSYVRVRVNRPA